MVLLVRQVPLRPEMDSEAVCLGVAATLEEDLEFSGVLVAGLLALILVVLACLEVEVELELLVYSVVGPVLLASSVAELGLLECLVEDLAWERVLVLQVCSVVEQAIRLQQVTSEDSPIRVSKADQQVPWHQDPS